jgi:small subunit ribosomal protein S16
MLTIRFARVGKVNKAQYKIVLQEKTAAPGGRHVEILGAYDPHLKQAVLKEDKIKEWIAKGAQLSDSVHNLLVTKKVITDKKRTVKMPEKKAEEVPAEGETPAEGEKTEAPATQEAPAEKVETTEAPAVEKKEELESEEVKKEEVKSEEAPKKE